MRATRAKGHRGAVIAVAVLMLIALLAVTALDGRLCVTEYEVESPKIPAGFGGLRLAVVADPHGSYMHKDSELAVRIAEKKADVILLLGDMLDETAPDMESFSEFLAELAEIAPVYAVSGNHDRWHDYYRAFLAVCESAGVTVLEDRACTLTRGSETIRLVGFADPEFWTAEPPEGCMDEVLEKLPAGDGFDLLLFHRANVFDHVADAGYELVISGHLHGGVVRFPFLGPVFKSLPVGDMTYAGGKYTVGESTLIVSRGLGNNTEVPRIFNRPELVMITLKASEE